ncbi:MAG TPA: outer membrane protein assembly factor BamA, partial [Alphaproteobacteria bacterium]|nr:outer membrane protein assembly factor BamA [Alphaproteobacteria bacterium]
EEVQIRPREVLSRSKIQTAQQRILEIYRRMGRFGATVEPKIIRQEDNRVDLIFEINEGDVTFIQKINFIGNKHFKTAKLQAALSSKVTRWYNFLATNDVFDPDRFNVDQDAVRNYYFSRGYPDFQILSAVAELSPDKKGFYLTFTVDEGNLYTFGEVDVVSQIDSIKPETLKPLITFKKGETFNSKEVDKTQLAITDEMGSRGYAFAQVEPVVIKDRENRNVSINFEIKEGPRVYVERIEIKGNDRTRDHVIRRELTLHEGDAYNTAQIKESERKLKDLNYFKTVNFETLPGSTPDKVVLSVGVEEQPTGELGLAAGFSTQDGPLANINFVEHNLMGKGQILHSSLTIAKKSQDFDVGFIEPYLFGRPLAGSIDVYSTRSTRISTYTQWRKGVELGIGYPLMKDLTQRFTYRIEGNDVKSVDSSASNIIKQQAGNTLTSALGHTLTYDKRDSKVEPTSGYVLTMSNIFAGVGGNVSYLSNVFSGSYYYSPMDDVIGVLKGSFGFMQRVGKTIRVTDSFQLGYDSLRGFEWAGVGPRDVPTGDSLGGTRFWKATAEVNFPLGLPNEFGMKGALFTDFGSLWKPGQQDAKTNEANTVRVSPGFGLLWTSPFGPIRIDYARPIKKHKLDKTQYLILGFSTKL